MWVFGKHVGQRASSGDSVLLLLLGGADVWVTAHITVTDVATAADEVLVGCSRYCVRHSKSQECLENKDLLEVGYFLEIDMNRIDWFPYRPLTETVVGM